MPKTYSGSDVIKILNEFGFVMISQKGSHIKLRGVRNGRLLTVIVPNHREIKRGTLSSILRQADVTRSEFEDKP